tara:strand:+ start:659 stop:1264 length:606 start_codon:yes stop_codon:yes gene_type:complete
MQVPNYFQELTDHELISNIKKNVDTDTSLKELVTRHSGIYITMVNSYVPQTNIFTNKEELIDDKEYNIYQAALKYDPTRQTKFSTYLGNETKWMCLNIYNKKRKHPEIASDELFLELHHYEATDTHEEELKNELFSKVIELIQEYPDDRITQIFNMRYIEGSKNKVMPWRRVSEEVDMSIQGCINIHNTTIKKLKLKLKEI